MRIVHIIFMCYRWWCKLWVFCCDLLWNFTCVMLKEQPLTPWQKVLVKDLNAWARVKLRSHQSALSDLESLKGVRFVKPLKTKFSNIKLNYNKFPLIKTIKPPSIIITTWTLSGLYLTLVKCEKCTKEIKSKKKQNVILIFWCF